MSSVKTKCRPTQLALSSGPGDSNGNSVACLGTPSLDSLRSLSDRDSTRAPDMECCLIEGSKSPANHHTDHLNCTCTANTPINGNLKLGSPPENSSLDLFTFPQNSTCTVLSPAVTVPGEGDILEPVQTSVSSCVNASLDNWNGNITLAITSLQGHHGDNQSDWGSTTSSGDRSVAASPELASPEGEESSSSVSLRGSSENNCSIGSGEMVMRWNSFCLEEADTLTVSLSLVELSTSSSAHGSPALPADLGHGLLSLSTTTTLPDVCDGLLENRPTDTLKVKDNPGSQCWGMTFIQSDDQDLPPEGDCLAPPRSPVDEAEGVHQATFLCEPTPSAVCGGASPAPSRRAGSDAYVSGGSTEGRTFMLPASEELDLDGRAQTSTPVQCAGNKPLDLPSLTESPCTGEQSHTGSPVVQTAIDQQGAAPMLASPKHCLVARLPPSSANRISKAEIKKFPKQDFSRVRPKIMSRPAHPLTLGSPAPAKNKPGKPVNQPCRKPSQVNRNTPMRNTPSKLATVEDGCPRAAVAENAVPDFHGMTFIQADDQDLSSAAGSHIGPLALSLTEEAECQASLCESVSAAFENVPPVPSSQATSRVSSEAEHVASNCGGGSAPVLPGNHTCFPSPTEQRADPAPALASPGKAGNKEEVPQRKRPGSVSSASSPSNQAPVSARRSRCWSESSSTTSIPHRESRTSPSGSASFIIPKAYVHLGQSQARPASHNRTGSAHNKPPETRKEAEERSSKEIKKPCLVTASSKTAMGATAAVGAACDRFKSRLGARPSLNRARGAPASAPQALPPVSRQRQGRDVCSSASSGMCLPRAKQSTTAGHQRSQTNEGVPVGTSSASGSTKPPVTGSRLPQASGHTLAVGSSQPSTVVSSSRLPYKSHGVPKSIPSKASVHNEHSGSTGNAQVSAGAAQVSVGRPTSCKTTVLKARLLSHPGSNIGPAGCKTTESTNRVPSRSRASPMKRTASSRLLRPAAVLPVDKNRPRATPRSHPQPQQQSPAPLPPQRDGHPDLVLAEGRAGGMESYRALCERKNQSLHQLQGLLAASNCKFEAIVVVLQQTLAEHDEVIKQRRDLSQELMTLKGELVNSARSCELLEREKDEVCGALEGVLQTMQEQHHTELVQLEERLRVFYQAEWDKIHLTYQGQADRCKALMEQQMTELRASHKAVTLELEASNSEQIQVVKQQYEESLKEFRQAHERELQTLDKKLKEAEATLSVQIQELIEENTTLNHRIKAEEDQRRELAERSQKDSHTLYLEQELESLKVVLDIKNKQLHQQDHKLMQMAKMTEKSVKLDECLKKVQQENEDLKARMDRHAALSRQLSTEQAVLQEFLHKESKVNKRLSMENEELIWKLHNGDPSSPHKLSPTSPSHHSLGLQSPRSSAVFTSPIQSPRSSAVFSSPPVSPR